MNRAAGHGRVHLVGAGPGSLGLVTLRARQLIEQAEVLVYDYLCNPEMLRWAKAGTEIIYAGKSASDHTLTQDEINALLVDRAQKNKVVVRLKGGDPYVFGRGGEEAQVLVRAGIPFEVVPGVTSAIAAPAYAGIPVTHRDFASTVTFVTGHEDPTKAESSIDWAHLARLRGTKIFLMGVERLRQITQRLIAESAAPETPVALVRWGTTGRQESMEGTLATIADLVEQRGFSAPAITIVGDVVKLRSELNWFEALPLFGQRIVVTRTRQQASALSRKLTQLGADVLEIPAIKIIPRELDSAQLDKLKSFGDHFDWVVFTSPNAVDRFFIEHAQLHADIRSLGAVKIAAVGPGTQHHLDKLRLQVDLMPEIYTTENLARKFSDMNVATKRFCLPHGDLADPLLANLLRERGASVEEWILYETQPETEDVTGARNRFINEGAHWITFTSSSTAQNWHALNLQPARPAPQPKAISLGPVTTATLKNLGYEVAAEAPVSTIDSLVETLRQLHIQSAMATKEELMDEGDTALAIGELDQAAEFFQRAIEQDPQFQDGWHALGMALYKLERYTEAIEAGKKAALIDPNNQFVWSSLSLAFNANKQKLEAEAAGAKAKIISWGGKVDPKSIEWAATEKPPGSNI